MLKVSSFSHTLEIGGARIKLPRQRFFSSARPFEGSLEALANILLEKYKPFISKSWRSILNNSNVVLGGFFSRYTWAPRQRTVELPKPSSMLYLQNGAVKLREEAARSMKVETGPYRLDESGFESALRSRSKKQVELFVRRVLSFLQQVVVMLWRSQNCVGCDAYLLVWWLTTLTLGEMVLVQGVDDCVSGFCVLLLTMDIDSHQDPEFSN